MRIDILRTSCRILFCYCLGIPTALPSESSVNGVPRLAREFASKPGAYDLATRVAPPIVDPGDKLRVEVYISGYGAIQAAKVTYYPSAAVFDPNASRWSFGLESTNGSLRWGAVSKKVDFNGGSVTFDCGGKDPNNPEEERWPAFFDLQTWDFTYQISTEVAFGGGPSPLYLDLTVDDSATPGPHSIHFVLTYFDGQTWKTASKNADFTIRNVYQRYEWWIARVGVLAAVATIGPMLRWPGLLRRRLRSTSALAAPPADRRATVAKDKKRSRAK